VGTAALEKRSACLYAFFPHISNEASKNSGKVQVFRRIYFLCFSLCRDAPLAFISVLIFFFSAEISFLPLLSCKRIWRTCLEIRPTIFENFLYELLVSL